MPSARCLIAWALCHTALASCTGRRKTAAIPLAPDPAALGCADRPLAAWHLVVMLPPASSGTTAGSASALRFTVHSVQPVARSV